MNIRLRVWEQRWYPVVLAVVATSVSAVFPLFSHGHFLSPDETANAAFARAFAEQRALTIPSVDVGDGNTFVRPRSVATQGADLIPGSFLAFPVLLGSIAAVAGSWSIEFVTVLVFGISILAFWRIAEYFFNSRAASLGATFYAFHPVVAYYAMRGLWHNGLVVSLALIGIALFVRASTKKSLMTWAAGVAVLCLAAVIRPSELPWLLLLAVLTALALRPLPRSWWWPAVLLPVLAGLGLLGLQQWAYDNPFYPGYAPTVVETDSAGETVGASVNLAQRILFPNGFQPVPGLQRFAEYSFSVVGLPTLIGLIGVAVVVARGQRARSWWLALATLGSFIWLIALYGSFPLTERFGHDEVVLGSSYLRYWLPGYVLLLLFVGPALAWLRDIKLSRWLIGGLVSFAIVSSVVTSVGDPLYGMVKALRFDLATGQAQRDVVLPLVPEDAAIFAGPADKVYFPERHVIGYNQLTASQAAFIEPLHQAGVAVFLTTGQADELRQANLVAKGMGLRFHRVLTLPGGDGLYELGQQENAE